MFDVVKLGVGKMSQKNYDEKKLSTHHVPVRQSVEGIGIVRGKGREEGGGDENE